MRLALWLIAFSILDAHHAIEGEWIKTSVFVITLILFIILDLLDFTKVLRRS